MQLNKKFIIIFSVLILLMPIIHAENALYSTIFTAPYCSIGNSPCVANSSLLMSRDSIRRQSEPNQPNTIDSCTDGTSGRYASDESIENITITDLDNSYFRAGDLVQVDVWAYCYDSSSDNINFVYTNNSATPSWRVVAFTNPCPASGFQKITKTFTLDNITGNHTLRAIIQYRGDTTSTCGTGSYDDNDDLVLNISSYAPVNHAPTQDNPILNSTYGTNKTNENLTCYNQSTYDADGDVVKNIYNWFKNGTPITLLNMPFEGTPTTTNVRDYSTYENNATEVNGATWSKISGYDSRGAFEFNPSSTTSYVKIPNSTSLVIKNTGYTLMAWIYPRSFGDNSFGRIITKGDDGTSAGLIFYVENTTGTEKLRIYHTQGSTYSYADSTDYSIKINQWQHVAVTFKNNFIHFYVNGQDVTLNSTLENMTEDTQNPLYIGDEADGSRTFDGYIDEVKIFNDSLSQEQIKAIYQNNTNTIVSQELAINQQWQCCITPNDGAIDGETKCSNNLTTNQAPTSTISKTIYYNCNPTMYYEAKFYDLNDNLIQESATFSIYNTTGAQKNYTTATATNGVYKGSFYLFGTYNLGEWTLKTTTDCYLTKNNFTVTEHIPSELMKINIYTIPSKIIYTQGELLTIKFQAINALGEGTPGLNSNIIANVSGISLTLIDDGDGWYSSTFDTSTLTPNKFYTIQVSAKNTTATITNSKSFYLKQ